MYLCTFYKLIFYIDGSDEKIFLSSLFPVYIIDLKALAADFYRPIGCSEIVSVPVFCSAIPMISILQMKIHGGK